MAGKGTGTVAAVVARIGIALVYLWFAVGQIIRPDDFVGWLPLWTDNLGIQPEAFVRIHGIGEALLAAALAIGVLTRLSAFLLAAQMVLILLSVLSLGPMEIAIRDFGVLVATLSVALRPPDALALDSWRARD